MRRLGYRVTMEQHASFGENDADFNGISHIYGTCSESAGFPVSLVWQIAAVYGPEEVG